MGIKTKSITKNKLAKSDNFLSKFIKNKDENKEVKLLTELKKSFIEDIKDLDYSEIYFAGENGVRLKSTEFSDYQTFNVKFPDPVQKKLKKIISLIEKTDVITAQHWKFHIDCDGVMGFNRTHFPDELPIELLGIGFGYKIYKALATHLGYIASNKDSSSSAQRLWSKLVIDPDFQVGINTYNVILFSKTFTDEAKRKIVLYDWLKHNKIDNIDNVKSLVMDDSLREIVNNVQLKKHKRLVFNY